MPTLEKTRTPGIYRRGGRYVVIWRHRGRQHKSFHRTYEEAREAKANLHTGEGRPASKLRFEAYFDEWIESYAGRTARGLTETSRELYRRSVTDHALPRWRGWRLGEIQPTDVRRLYGELRDRDVSTSGLRGVRAPLSAMFATALEDGLVNANPVRGVRIPPPRDGAPLSEKRRSLTRSELAALLQALPEERRMFFEFLTHTGLRISEVLALQWRHIVLDGHPRVLVREQLYEGTRRTLKSKHARRDVPLSPGMALRLRDLRRQSDRDRGPLFATKSGTELNRSNLATRVLKPAATAVDLTVERKGKEVAWVSFHTFRHTCASLLFEQGRNVKQVAEWLGHADPSFTLRTYVHLMDAGVGDAAFFDQALSNTSGV